MFDADARPGHGMPERRRRFLVRPTFQLRSALLVGGSVALLAALLSTVLSGLLLHYATAEGLTGADLAAQRGWVVFAFAATFAAISGAGVFIWCVLITHRVCGPISVLERQLAVLADGRMPSPRSIRKTDEFQELYAAFGRMLRTLRASRGAELNVLEKALEYARAGIDADPATRTEVLRTLAHQLTSLRDEVKNTLRSPNVEPPVEHVTTAFPSESASKPAPAPAPA